MTARQFFDLVAEMRRAQREYFKTRRAATLDRSKRLEREVDGEIASVRAIIEGRPLPPAEADIFDAT